MNNSVYAQVTENSAAWSIPIKFAPPPLFFFLKKTEITIAQADVLEKS